MKKLLLLFGLIFAVSQAICAQTESGTYVVYIGDQILAEETFVSEKLSDGSVKVNSKIATNTFTTLTKNERPLEMTIEANGAKVLTMTFANGEAKTLLSGELEKTTKTAASVILENGVWSQFVNLLAQYDGKKGGAQNFTGFLPSQSYEFPLTLERGETKDFKLKTQTVSATKYKLVNTKTNLEVEIWADKANMPLLIEIPSQQVNVVKKGYEELRDAMAPLKKQLMIFNGEFTSEEVSFPNGEITLAGTLTVPKNDAKTFPAIIIITGSGGQDRDGSTIFNLYKQVAEALSKAGVAVLRVDDRGTGKSTIIKEKAIETSYRDLISDSRAAFDYLTTRKEVDKSRIGFLGHSEGAETALTIASEDKRIAAIVLMAGASRPISESVSEQEIYQRASQETVNASDKSKIMPVAQTLLREFEAAKQPQNANDKKLSWFRDHLASNPSQLAANVKCPVLILQGERDALVLAYHSVELAKALANGGNETVSLRILPNLTHLFAPVSDKPEEASKISEEMLQTLQNWAHATLIEKPKS